MKRQTKYFTILFICIALVISGAAQQPKKLRIALLDFTNSGGLSKQGTVTLGNRLRSMLVKTNAFIVLERGQMDDVLDEQGFQQTGCTTTECAVEMGRMLNVEKMVSGTIGKLGQTYTIDLSLIDVQTAQIERSFFRDFKGEIDGLLNLMQEIANQMATIVYQQSEVKPDAKIVDLEINSDPDNATIFINDRKAGKTPFKSSAKEGLAVTIRVEKENYKSWIRTITIKEGDEVEAELEYTDAYKQALAAGEASEGGSSLWWWIGGGALVAGGAAVLLMSGSKEDEPSPELSTFPMPPDRP